MPLWGTVNEWNKWEKLSQNVCHQNSKFHAYLASKIIVIIRRGPGKISGGSAHCRFFLVCFSCCFLIFPNFFLLLNFQLGLSFTYFLNLSIYIFRIFQKDIFNKMISSHKKKTPRILSHFKIITLFKYVKINHMHF